jgi:hypothetical protein
MKRNISILLITLLILVIFSLVLFAERAKYDFERTYWGMSKEQVKAAEKVGFPGKMLSETENEIDFESDAFGGNFSCVYLFLEDKLYQGGYVFMGKHKNKPLYAEHYNELKETLIREYGKPKIDNKELHFKFNEFNEIESSWLTATWETSATIINLGLVFIKNKTVLAITYSSKELEEWAKQIKEKKL